MRTSGAGLRGQDLFEELHLEFQGGLDAPGAEQPLVGLRDPREELARPLVELSAGGALVRAGQLDRGVDGDQLGDGLRQHGAQRRPGSSRQRFW